MKPLILFICASALAVAAPCTSSPGSWCESTDAGPFINNAQATLGTGTLNSIIGNIGNGTAGSDLYSIIITNPSTFSATFAGFTAPGYASESNAAIYLFDASGHGVEAAAEGTALTGFNDPAGLYYIGIVPDGNTPESTQGAIFSPFVNGQISLPVAGAGPLDNYTRAGCGVNCQGAYDITLSSAQYSNAPEPAPIALLGTVLTSLSLLYRSKGIKP